jgi:PAS domain S-box-containing protein
MIDGVPLVPFGVGHRGSWRHAGHLARVEAARYGPAVATIAITLGLALALRGLIDPSGLFLVAVAIATWSRGWRSGLLAAVLATVTVDYFFIVPIHSVIVASGGLPRLAVFVLCALVVNWASDARHIAAERARQDSERELAALFDEAPIGIALIDAAGHAFKTNPSLQQMLGYSAGEFRRMSFTKLIHPPGVESDWNLFAELTHARRRSYQLEKHCVAKGGATVPAHITVSLVRTDRGDPLFGIALVERRGS